MTRVVQRRAAGVGLRGWLKRRRRKAEGILALVVLLGLTQVLSERFLSELVELLRRLVPDGVFTEAPAEAGAAGGDVPWGALVLLALAVLGWIADWDRLTRVALYLAGASATLFLLLQVITLVLLIPSRTGTAGGERLLIDALLVWTSNGVVFALWHWMLDAGGPDRRGTPQEQRPDLLFPQRQTPDLRGWEDWQPRFGDYLYVAFNVNATFGTGDTYVLSWRCKQLVMGQALLSLTILVMLAARAINIIAS